MFLELFAFAPAVPSLNRVRIETSRLKHFRMAPHPELLLWVNNRTRGAVSEGPLSTCAVTRRRFSSGCKPIAAAGGGEVSLTRDQTLMQGAPSCTFRYKFAPR
jgi:hypothetical protein